jgi:transposase
MVRESSLVSEAEQQQLEQALEQSPRLKRIYEARLELQQVWRRRGESMDAMLEALRAWCREAEESGIQALRDFADELKSYTVPSRTAAA